MCQSTSSWRQFDRLVVCQSSYLDRQVDWSFVCQSTFSSWPTNRLSIKLFIETSWSTSRLSINLFKLIDYSFVNQSLQHNITVNISSQSELYKHYNQNLGIISLPEINAPVSYLMYMFSNFIQTLWKPGPNIVTQNCCFIR